MQKRTNKRKVFNLSHFGLNGCLDFGYYHYNKVEPVLKPHNHKEALEICFCLTGQQYYEIEDHIVKMKGNDILIIPPNVTHSSGIFPEDIGALFWLQISMQKDKGHLCNLPDRHQDYLLRELNTYGKVIFNGAFQLEPILKKILALLEEPQSSFNELLLNQLIIQLLIETLLLAKKPKKIVKSEKQKIIKDFIEKNMHRIIYVDELAALINLSTAYFKTWFKENFGIPPKAYINRFKIEQAKNDLLNKSTITQVAFELGFSSSQYFATIFKKHTGITPKSYIASSIKKEDLNFRN